MRQVIAGNNVIHAPGEVFRAEVHQMLRKGLELLGVRHVTRAEIFETLDLVACGEV